MISLSSFFFGQKFLHASPKIKKTNGTFSDKRIKERKGNPSTDSVVKKNKLSQKYTSPAGRFGVAADHSIPVPWI